MWKLYSWTRHFAMKSMNKRLGNSKIKIDLGFCEMLQLLLSWVFIFLSVIFTQTKTQGVVCECSEFSTLLYLSHWAEMPSVCKGHNMEIFPTNTIYFMMFYLKFQELSKQVFFSLNSRPRNPLSEGVLNTFHLPFKNVDAKR